jgi:DNA modification methylase
MARRTTSGIRSFPCTCFGLHGEGSRGRELRSSFSTQQPFTTTVAASNLRQLKTEWIWEKARSTGFLNAKKYPLKSHENILVFCDRLPPYFPQKTMGAKPYVTRRPPSSSTNYSGDKGFVSVNTDGSRYPTSILRFPSANATDRGLHPTQKPLALLEYLVRTYMRQGDVLLDCCAGSGSSLVAALSTGRRFVGIERDPIYYATALERLKQAHK